MKQTPEFPGSVKPVRKGVYSRRFLTNDMLLPFSHWDGKRWHVGAHTPELATTQPISGYQPDRLHTFFFWRGVLR